MGTEFSIYIYHYSATVSTKERPKGVDNYKRESPVLFCREHRTEPHQSHFVWQASYLCLLVPQLGEDRLLEGGSVEGPSQHKCPRAWGAPSVQMKFRTKSLISSKCLSHSRSRWSHKGSSALGSWETQCVEPLIGKKKRSHLCSVSKIPQAYLWKLIHWHLSIDYLLIQL